MYTKQGRNQLIFSGGAKWYNLLLYLTDTYVFKNFGGGQLPDLPPLVVGLTQNIGILPGPTKRIDELNDNELDEFYCTS